MFQGGAVAGGVVLEVAHGEELCGGVLLVDGPGLTPDAGAAVPRHVGHGEAVLKTKFRFQRESESVHKNQNLDRIRNNWNLWGVFLEKKNKENLIFKFIILKQ